MQLLLCETCSKEKEYEMFGDRFSFNKETIAQAYDMTAQV